MNEHDDFFNDFTSDRTAEEIIASLEEQCKYLKETYTKENLRRMFHTPCFYGTPPEWDSKQSLKTNKEDL